MSLYRLLFGSPSGTESFPQTPQTPSPPYPSYPLDRQQQALREALERWWALTAQGPRADQAEVARTYQELLRLHDEIGEPLATRLRQQWAEQWWQGSGICPWCGEPGEYHAPMSEAL